MTINFTADLWQLLGAMGSGVTALCLFQWWVFKKYSNIGDRLTELENRVMYRIEALELMKNLDRFCNQLTSEMQIIVGKKLDIDHTDFQTDLIKKQQRMDERVRPWD